MTEHAAKKDEPDRAARLRAGDEQAFAEFVREYQNLVFLCCRALGLRNDEAEDVARRHLARGFGRSRITKALASYAKKGEGPRWLQGLADGLQAQRTPGARWKWKIMRLLW